MCVIHEGGTRAALAGVRAVRSYGVLAAGWCIGALRFAGLCAALGAALGYSAAQAANPGVDDPISTPDRRMLFPDQHALVAMPQDPSSSSTAITNTDWSRNADATNLELRDSFGATLNGIAQARSATGHILSQADEQVAIARFVGSGADNIIQVDVLAPDGAVPAPPQQFPAWSTTGAFPGASIANSFGIASGELSLLEDATGAGHDEVVVCYPAAIDSTQGFRAYVTVLDYTEATDDVVLQTSALGSSPWFFSIEYASDSTISCEAADLNGDGIDEVVLAYAANNRVYVEVFSYGNNGEDPPNLDRIGQPLELFGLYNRNVPRGEDIRIVGGSVDVATGDFNSDGRIDIGVAAVSRQFVSSRFAGTVWVYPSIYVISSDAAFNLKLESTFVTNNVADIALEKISTEDCILSGAVCEIMRAVMVSGLFGYSADAERGLDFNRRQLAVVFNMPFDKGGGLHALSLSVSDDLKRITQSGATVTIAQQACETSLCPSGSRFSLDTGGYVGSAEIENPLWSLLVANWETQSGGNGEAAGQFRLVWLKAEPPGSAGGFNIAQDSTLLDGAQINGPINARLPVAAWDREGNSVWLGSPVHLTLYDLIKAEYIIQEPPKHTYWWPPSATSTGDGQIIDLSRVQDFFIELSDSESRDYSFTHKDQTDWTIGGGVAVTGKGSVTLGVDGGLFGSAKATASLSVRGKVDYDYNENVDSYDSSYRSQTTTFAGETNADDLLIAQVMRLDVWRFPVSGIELDDGLNAFWEIVLPGDKLTAQGGGLNFDWYQPPHENGNVLSYPPLAGSTYTPADCCAEFTFVENSEEVTKASPFLDNRLLFWDGTGATINLQFSEQSGQGSTKSYTHSLKESLDVQVGYKTELSFAGSKTEAETQVDVNVNNNNSWADVDIDSASTNNTTGFRLTKPPGNANQSYAFLPVFYLAESGTTKVTHAADVLGTGATFWPQTYGSLPDPALNLPRRFSATTPDKPNQFVWVVNESDDARRIRGFFVRYDELSEGDGYPLVGGSVDDGQAIRIEAEVFNYSTGQGVDGLDVGFEAVKYNPVTNTEIGDRIPLDCTTESVTKLFLNPLEMRTARCVWDTTGFGPNVGGAVQNYRVYVTLDPDDSIDELYDGTVGPGQNNEGWGLVGIAHPEDTFRTPTPTQAVPNGADVHMTDVGLALEVDGELVTGFAHTVREQLTPLRVCVNTDQTQTGYHHVLIWDGDPAAGGRLIADKMLTGVDVNGDSCTWLQDFRFAEAGDHILHAQVSEAQSDALLGNATDILEVTVASIPTIAPYLAEGLATNVGETGEFTLSGRFRYDGDLNLAASKLVIASVLDEIDGAGELIPGVGEQTGQELVLQPHFSLENRAVYRTPRGQLPRVSAVLSVHQARLGLSLRVSDAEIRKPFLCGHRTELTTALVVLDGEKAPLNLAMTEPWICERRFNDNGGTLRLNQSWR